MPNETASSAVRLSDYFGMLRRHWWVVLLAVLLGAGLAVGYLGVAPREYTARTSVLVTVATSEAGGTSARPAEINLDTEAQLLTSTETVTAVAALLDLSSDELADLADRVTVSVPPNTEILTIGYVGPTAVAAREGAEAFAEAYLDGRRTTAEAGLEAEFEALQDRVEAVEAQLEQVTEAGERLPEGSTQLLRNEEKLANLSTQLAALNSQQNQVRAAPVTPGRVITQAALPVSPSSPDIGLTVAAGILLGLLAGLALAALRYRADDSIRTAEDLERRTGVRVAGILSDRLADGQVALVSAQDADTRAYGLLRNLVTSSMEGSRRPAVVVAGVHRGGGPVAANLAASLARLGEDVVLVCADVFGSTAADLLGDAPATGLTEVLSGSLPVERVVRRLPGLTTLNILAPGSDPQRADALLQTRALRDLIARLLESSAYVVIEAPATTLSPAAQTLAHVAEAAVLVVEQGSTTAREVADAQMQFDAMRRQVLGAVLVTFGRDDAVHRPAAAAPEPLPVRAGAGRAAELPAEPHRRGSDRPDPALR